MRRGIVAHEVYLDASNVGLLNGMSFVFIAMDGGLAKKAVIEHLQRTGVQFIDVGLGVELVDGVLTGNLRVTTSSVAIAGGVAAGRDRIWLCDDEGENEYAQNIQLADLNALNAAFAVIKWKKLLGVYFDDSNEFMSLYVLAGNAIVNEDKA